MKRDYIEIRYDLGEECWLAFRLYREGALRGCFQHGDGGTYHMGEQEGVFETLLSVAGEPVDDFDNQLSILLNRALGFDEVTDGITHEAHKAIAELHDTLWR